MTTPLVTNALRMGLWRRDRTGHTAGTGLIHHSDDRLNTANFEAENLSAQSTSTTWSDRWAESGQAGDNAAMESFFALVQKNVLDTHRWDNREQLRIAIVTWIERAYHRCRRQAALGRLTPIEYETIMNQTVAQAA